MKKIVYILKEHGCVTPEAQAEFLARNAHLEGIVKMTTFYGDAKYYTYNGDGFVVISVDGHVAQVNKMDVDEVKRIVKCSELKFGGF